MAVVVWTPRVGKYINNYISLPYKKKRKRGSTKKKRASKVYRFHIVYSPPSRPRQPSRNRQPSTKHRYKRWQSG